jgi:hypothetical protein
LQMVDSREEQLRLLGSANPRISLSDPTTRSCRLRIHTLRLRIRNQARFDIHLNMNPKIQQIMDSEQRPALQ